jgi:hypothetical protein
VIGRALAALTRFGERIQDQMQRPEEMVDDKDPKRRLAAVPIVRAMPPSQGVPLLRRLVADQDQDVRHAGVDAIEDVATKDKDQAIKLYKPLVRDADPVVRAKAQGQLARLVPPPPPLPPPGPKTAAVPPPPPPPPPPTPTLDAALPKVQLALDGAKAASDAAKTAAKEVEELVAEVATITAAAAQEDATIDRLKELKTELDKALANLETVAAKPETEAKAASDAAGASPSPDAAKLVEQARALAQGARDVATATRGKAADAMKPMAKILDEEIRVDPQIYLDAARAAIASGALPSARQNLNKAAKLLPKAGAKRVILDDLSAQLYDKMAARAQDPAAKRKLLKQAEEAYGRVERTGAGPLVRRAKDRRAEIAEEIKELGPP